MDSSRASTPFRNLAIAVASTLIGGGLIEGVARLLEPPPVQREEYLWDWSERFSEGDFYTLEKGEGYPPNEETNVDGLRDITRPVEARDGLRRFLILGDSVAFGHGLVASEAFPQVLERKLRSRGLEIDVFNAALPGWSTRQERLAYERIGRKYKPTDVLLAVCLNDLAELQINLTKPPPGALLTLFKGSAAVRLALGASRREIGSVEELFTAPDSPRVLKAFRLFFEEVIRLRDAATKDGASFHIVFFPFRFQVEPGAPKPAAQERVEDFARRESIMFHDFLEEVRADPSAKDLFLDYDHFNQSGHQRVAEWLYHELQEILPLRPDGPPPLPRTADEALRELTKASTDIDHESALWRVREQAPHFAKGSVSRLNQLVVELAVTSASPRVRFEAARTVFYLGLPGETSAEALIRGVKHEDPRVRVFATWTLGEMGSLAQPAVPALVALAKQDGGAGKTGALTAIGKIGGESPETVPLLLDELKHPKENRRYRAARTIGKMGPAAAAAVPGLIEALHDPSPLVRLHVVRALGNLGDSARTAVPALIEVLNGDPDREVRKEVSLTLSRLPGR